MNYIFNIFENDPKLLKTIQNYSTKLKIKAEKINSAENAVINLYDYDFFNKMLSNNILSQIQEKINNGYFIYNKSKVFPKNVKIIRNPISQ